MSLTAIKKDDETTRLEWERRTKGWSLRELAQISGVSLSTIVRAEKSQDIKLSHGILLAKALECRVESLWKAGK